jgi:serine protease
MTMIAFLVLVGACPTFAATVLQNHVAVTNISGSTGNKKYYTISVPAGQTKLTIKTSGGSGDCDIYVKLGGTPSTSTYDYKATLSGNNETITINNPASGTWNIMLYGYSSYSGLSLLADYEVSSTITYTTLNDGQAVTNISGSTGNKKYYKISVPSGQTKLTIKTSGGSGDCDTYVKLGGTPSTSDYGYKGTLSGNNETITINTPASGIWNIMLSGYSAYSGMSLLADYEVSSTIIYTTLNDGQAVTSISGSTGNKKYYTISVPSGQTKLTIKTSGGSGDCDTYVKLGGTPSTSTYDYKTTLSGNNETITINTPASGTWNIMLSGYSAYSGMSLLADYEAAVTPPAVITLTNGQVVTGLADASGGQKFFKINVPASMTKLEIKISGGTGDCDLYVKFGSQPTMASYDYRPYTGGNNETVTVNNPSAGVWYVMLRGYSGYSGLSLVAKYEATKYTIQLDNNISSALIVGQSVQISGTIMQNGTPAVNLSFSVCDGIAMVCRSVTTNSLGRFSFTTTPAFLKASMVQFVIGSQVISAGYDVKNLNNQISPIVSAIQIQNTTSNPFKAVVSSPFGNQLTYFIQPGETKQVVSAGSSAFNFHPTGFTGNTGVGYSVPLVVGDIGYSVTTNSDLVAKVKITGGMTGWLRFSVYGTSELDIGGCWSPGGAIPGIGAGSFDLCLGTDSFNFGGSLRAGTVVNGFSIQLIKW